MKDLFESDGFLRFKLLSPADYCSLKAFAIDWVHFLLKTNIPNFVLDQLAIENYHNWPMYILNQHEQIFVAKNRHQVPPLEIYRLLGNQALYSVLKEVGIKNNPIFWDEGLGWLGFRLIRPNSSDGYPLSKKSWGPAKSVFSVYVPIVGLGSDQSIGLVKGSHLKDYSSYLPVDSKFCKDELRVDLQKESVQLTRLALEPGEALIFGPNMLHTEKIETGTLTRLSLEFRIPAEHF